MSTVNTILENNLCIGCGLCKLVCPAVCIEMVWTDKSCWEPKIDDSACTKCGACLNVCPNSPVNLNKSAKKALEFKEEYGLSDAPDNKFAITWDSREDIRAKSPSGGTSTTLLEHMLKNNIVDSAVVARPLKGKIGDPHFETFVCRDIEELFESRCSAYGPLRYDLVLAELTENDETCAITVLPCLMRGIQALPDKYRKHIKYTIGIMCSHCVSDQFGDYMAVRNGIKSIDTFSINYRDNKDISDADSFNTCFRIDDKKEIRTSRWTNGFTTGWRKYLFAREACLYCPDFYVADADISVKDAWGRLSIDPLGITLAVVRNEEITALLKNMSNDNTICYEKCDCAEIKNSQNATAVFKQVDFVTRWKQNKLLKKSDVVSKEKQDTAIKKDYFGKRRTLRFSSNLEVKLGCSTFVKCHKTLRVVLSVLESISKWINSLFKSVYRRCIAVWGAFVRFIGLREPRAQKSCLYSVKELELSTNSGGTPAALINKLNVLITGGYGYGNVGDEAQLGANIKRWQKLTDCSIKVFSPNPAYTTEHHEIKSCWAPRVVLFNSNRSGDYGSSNKAFEKTFKKKKRKLILSARFLRAGINFQFTSLEEAELLHTIMQTDVLHVSGGGFLTGMTRSRLWENALVMRLAYMLGTPVILTGQTIGVFKSKQDRKIAKWGLKNAQYIFLRDKEGSEKDLKSIGLSGSHIESTFDDALFCDKVNDDVLEKLLRYQLIDAGKPYVVANFHYWGQNFTMQKKAAKRFAELCDYIIDKYELQIMFVPMVVGDEEAELDVINNMKNQKSVLLKYNYDYKVARGVISKAEFLLTMKHHPIIFAHGEGVPVVSVTLDDYYYRKNFGAMKNSMQEKYCIGDSRFFSEEAESVIDEMFANMDIEREKLKDYIEHRAKMMEQKILNILSKLNKIYNEKDR